MILHYFKNGPQILLDNTEYFDNAREAGACEENQYWDEHALNEQRYYRLLCYAYAKSPEYIEKQLQYFFYSWTARTCFSSNIQYKHIILNAELPGRSSLSLNSKYAKIINSSNLSNTNF